MNETIQGLLDGLYDALPATLEQIAKLLDSDPQVVELRQTGRTDRARIRADEDIQRARVKRNIDTAIEYVDSECQFLIETDDDLDLPTYSVNDVVHILVRVRNILE